MLTEYDNSIHYELDINPLISGFVPVSGFVFVPVSGFVLIKRYY